MCEFHDCNCNGLGDISWTDKCMYFSSIDVIEIYARTMHRRKGLTANYNGYFHALYAPTSGQLTRRVAYFVCADISQRGNLPHGNMTYVHSTSIIFQKQRLLCAEHAQTKSAPKPLQNTFHEKRALDRQATLILGI